MSCRVECASFHSSKVDPKTFVKLNFFELASRRAGEPRPQGTQCVEDAGARCAGLPIGPGLPLEDRMRKAFAELTVPPATAEGRD